MPFLRGTRSFFLFPSFFRLSAFSSLRKQSRSVLAFFFFSQCLSLSTRDALDKNLHGRLGYTRVYRGIGVHTGIGHRVSLSLSICMSSCRVRLLHPLAGCVDVAGSRSSEKVESFDCPLTTVALRCSDGLAQRCSTWE